jgi:cytochrome c oxidase subunit I
VSEYYTEPGGILVNQRIDRTSPLHYDLDRTWRRPRGVLGWLCSTNHKDIGLRFIVTAMFFFGLAGILALFMRLQLAQPQLNILSADRYNQFFTTHGTAMMFLFAVPIMEGIGLYLVPLMVGSRNVSFPRLMNFAYYIYALSGLVLFGSLAFDLGADRGWFNYVPLSGPAYSPGMRVDIWLQVVTMVEFSALAGAVDVVATVFTQRAPGMTLHRIPLLVWSQLITALMIIFAMPSVMLCSMLLEVDRLRLLGTHFYNPAEGGDSMLWQHLFWIFGHPEVYIIFIPATGFISSILPVFCRRPIFGYTPLVLSMVATAFIGFGVWVHHMFATPIRELGQGLFTASSLLITIPNGVQIFCWLATLWGGRPQLNTPLLFVTGFILVFLVGGLSGVMLASVSLDIQVHDTYFIVAHFHYVLIGGAVFPLFGALYYWFPKWTGRMLSERMGLWNFALMLIGFNLTFFPMHDLGLRGMTRRIYTYVPQAGWADLNLLATIGAFLLGLSVLLFLVNVITSLYRGKVAGPDPWGAGTLEWATTSPPPSYGFLYVPTVASREPLWALPHQLPVVTGLRTDIYEVLVTTAHDALPNHRYQMAGPSVWPLILALVMVASFLGLNVHAASIAIGAAVVTLVLVAWYWPGFEPKSLRLPHRRAEVE